MSNKKSNTYKELTYTYRWVCGIKLKLATSEYSKYLCISTNGAHNKAYIFIKRPQDHNKNNLDSALCNRYCIYQNILLHIRNWKEIKNMKLKSLGFIYNNLILLSRVPDLYMWGFCLIQMEADFLSLQLCCLEELNCWNMLWKWWKGSSKTKFGNRLI